MTTASPAARTMMGILVSMGAGLCVWLICPERKIGPVSVACVAPSGAELKARASVQTKEEFVSAIEASLDTQKPAKTKLTDDESAAISERMAEAKGLLDALDVRNATVRMDHITDTYHIAAARVDAPSVEQLAPIYDLLSKASKDFPDGSEAAKEFRTRAALFLREVGSSDFRYIAKSTNVVTGEVIFKLVRPRAKSVTVELTNGSMYVNGPHTTTIMDNAGNEFRHLFSDK